MPKRMFKSVVVRGLVLTLVSCLVFTPFASAGRVPDSLKKVPVPEPVNLGDFVKNKTIAIALGKTLFWDMQVGSDGIQACASCHFHAGADNRFVNQVSPGLLAGDTTFLVRGPNQALEVADFPFHQRVASVDEFESAVLRDSNDVVSSVGVFFSQFLDIALNNPVDLAAPIADPVFNVSGINTRCVEPRGNPDALYFVRKVMSYLLICSCGDKTTVRAKNRPQAVDKLNRLMNRQSVKEHIKVKHPGEAVLSRSQIRTMIERNLY